MVVFGQNWLYSGKSGCIRAKVVVLGQKFCIRQDGFIRLKVFVFCQKLLFSRKSGSVPAKVVVFGQSDCIWAKWL